MVYMKIINEVAIIILIMVKKIKYKKNDKGYPLSFSFANNYSIISETTPDPTVLPPSRIANLNPFSIAIGVINSISIVMLSRGITISVPVGNSIITVTYVVLK